MKTRVKPPANYFGGKAGSIGAVIADIVKRQAPRIFAQPCGGMSGVSFFLDPIPQIEVYNDLDRRLYILFEVLRDKKLSKLLIEQVRLMPYGRDSYLKAHRVLKTAFIPEIAGRENEQWKIGVALATYVAISQAIQPSLRHNGWRNGGGKFDASVAKMWKKRTLNLAAVTDRITDWILENQDLTKVIMRYNQPDALIYLDPPYVHSTRNNNRVIKTVQDYSCEMTEMEHEIMLCVSTHSRIVAKVLISGYDNVLYNTMLKDWHRLDIPVISGIAAANKSDSDDGSRIETLWANFPIKLTNQLTIF
jgi:DNA adenine methylase